MQLSPNRSSANPHKQYNNSCACVRVFWDNVFCLFVFVGTRIHLYLKMCSPRSTGGSLSRSIFSMEVLKR